MITDFEDVEQRYFKHVYGENYNSLGTRRPMSQRGVFGEAPEIDVFCQLYNCNVLVVNGVVRNMTDIDCAEEWAKFFQDAEGEGEDLPPHYWNTTGVRHKVCYSLISNRNISTGSRCLPGSRPGR